LVTIFMIVVNSGRPLVRTSQFL